MQSYVHCVPVGGKTIVVGGFDVGGAYAECLEDGDHISVPWDTPEGEALALLLVSVLAAAKESTHHESL